jgi:hypothetical protein
MPTVSSSARHGDIPHIYPLGALLGVSALSGMSALCLHVRPISTQNRRGGTHWSLLRRHCSGSASQKSDSSRGRPCSRSGATPSSDHENCWPPQDRRTPQAIICPQRRIEIRTRGHKISRASEPRRQTIRYGMLCIRHWAGLVGNVIDNGSGHRRALESDQAPMPCGRTDSRFVDATSGCRPTACRTHARSDFAIASCPRQAWDAGSL